MRMRAVFPNIISAITICLLAGSCAEGRMTRSTGAERQAAINSLTSETPPQSTEMARGQCWMKYENTKAARNLDEKIKLVDQCIEEKKRKYPMTVQ